MKENRGKRGRGCPLPSRRDKTDFNDAKVLTSLGKRGEFWDRKREESE